MKNDYQVIVSNVGVVYTGFNKKNANRAYLYYIESSKGSYGKVAGESVTLTENGEPIREFY